MARAGKISPFIRIFGIAAYISKKDGGLFLELVLKDAVDPFPLPEKLLNGLRLRVFGLRVIFFHYGSP